MKFISIYVLAMLAVMQTVLQAAPPNVAENLPASSPSEDNPGPIQFSQWYSSMQGVGNWYYCYQDANTGACTPMTWQTDHWQGRHFNSRIRASELDPDTDVTVLKWLAPKTGNIGISGTVWCLQTNSDGVLAAIKVNGKQLWPKA